MSIQSLLLNTLFNGFKSLQLGWVYTRVFEGVGRATVNDSHRREKPWWVAGRIWRHRFDFLLFASEGHIAISDWLFYFFLFDFVFDLFLKNAAPDFLEKSLFLFVVLFIFLVWLALFRTWLRLAIYSANVLIHLVHVYAVERPSKHKSQEVKGGDLARDAFEQTHDNLTERLGLELDLADLVFGEVVLADAATRELKENSQENVVF